MVDPLILALDVESLQEARRFVRLLKGKIKIFKVGLQLFTAAGPDAVKMVQDEGGKVFLDLKFHDIPHTVARACESAARLGVFMLDLHASGGREMLEAARAAVSKPSLVGVTILTSRASESGTGDEVVRLATLCQESGLDGVVCSPLEIEAVRKACGKNFLIVTPGIRPTGSASGDQKRTSTAAEAIQKGSNYLVVGRPILTAADPVKAVQSLIWGLSAPGPNSRNK